MVVSQTWAEVHRVNEKVREKLKSKGLVGANEVTIQTLEKVDLTNAQKRDAQYYPPDAVIVFNQKVREAKAGATGKLGGIVEVGVLVVDDLVDTGQTAKMVRAILPDAHFAAVYAKPMGRPLVDTFVTEVSQDTWIFFPWDTGLAFQPPIRDGAA